MINSDYYIRQTGLIDPVKLDTPIMIVGAGGIGSWASLALAKLGCQNLHVLDFDEVEVHNVGSQIYTPADEGRAKVDALKEKLELLTDTSIEPWYSRFVTSPTFDYPIVISAVDNMTTRKAIFDSRSPGQTLIDGRMAGNAVEIYTVNTDNPLSVERYKKTLFADEEGLHIPCSERAVVYNCFVMAGLIASIVSQLANGRTPPEELVVDLLNFTMFK